MTAAETDELDELAQLLERLAPGIELDTAHGPRHLAGLLSHRTRHTPLDRLQALAAALRVPDPALSKHDVCHQIVAAWLPLRNAPHNTAPERDPDDRPDAVPTDPVPTDPVVGDPAGGATGLELVAAPPPNRTAGGLPALPGPGLVPGGHLPGMPMTAHRVLGELHHRATVTLGVDDPAATFTTKSRETARVHELLLTYRRPADGAWELVLAVCKGRVLRGDGVVTKASRTRTYYPGELERDLPTWVGVLAGQHRPRV